MAKGNSLLRKGRRDRADDKSVISRGAAEQAVEQVYLCQYLSVLETLVEDFAFNAEQIEKFKEISEIKFKQKRVQLEHRLSITP